MAESLDQEQRAKTRYFLGYINLENRAFGGTMPVIIPQQGTLEQNMRSILDTYSLTIVVDLIDQIECSREQIKCAKSRLKAIEIPGAVKLNRYEISQLWQEDLKLCYQLANLLATPLYWHPTGAGVGPAGGGNDMNGGGNGNIRLYD